MKLNVTVHRWRTWRRTWSISSRCEQPTWPVSASHRCPVKPSCVRSGPSPYQVHTLTTANPFILIENRQSALIKYWCDSYWQRWGKVIKVLNLGYEVPSQVLTFEFQALNTAFCDCCCHICWNSESRSIAEHFYIKWMLLKFKRLKSKQSEDSHIKNSYPSSNFFYWVILF